MSKRIALGLVLSALAVLPAVAEEKPAKPAPKAEKEAEGKADAPREWEWVFFYYMAYDNNLEGCGRPILDMLKAGITADSVAIVTIADFRERKGMRRYEQTKGEEKVTTLETEASADEATLKEQLAWTKEHYSAKRYAIVFLDHGNRLSEMSYDEYPGVKDGKDWLGVTEVAPVLEEWRKGLKGKLELVFIQQCGKGALENFHAFREVAPYVMASQTVVGAPNYYYTKAIKTICDKPDVDGKELSHLFQQHETDDMFITYTTLNEKALNELPKKLDAVLAPLLEVKDLKKPAILSEYPNRREKTDGAYVRMCFQPARDESFVDGLALLKSLYEVNGLETKAYDAFAKWAKDELITEHRVSPDQKEHAGGWCGFSLFIPRTKAALERYQKDYPIYKETQLDELMARLID